LQSDVEDNAEFLEWFSFAMDGAALTGVIIVSTVAISFDHVLSVERRPFHSAPSDY